MILRRSIWPRQPTQLVEKPSDFSGLGASQNFGIDAATTTCTTSSSLASGDSCQIGVIFAPTAGGSLSGNLTLTDNSLNVNGNTQSVQLSGIGSSTAATTTIVSAPPITYGASANVTVTVTSGQGTVTGNVALTVDNASPLTQSLSGGSTVFTISGLPAGSHSLSASYTAQGSFGASSVTGTQTVNQASSGIVLMSSGSPTIWGQNVNLTAAITPQNGGVATGTVTFNDGAAALATVNVSGNAAGFSTTTLGAGTHSITATYSGDSNVAGSSSSAISQLVNQSTTIAILASSANPSYVGQSVTFTTTVTGQQGGSLSGTVSVKQGATTVATVGLVNGQAVYSTNYTTTGTRSMTAVYSGDSNNLTSTSAVLKQAVNSLPAATTTKVATSGSPSLINQPVTFTATITSSYGMPDNETVTFYDGATAIGTGLTVGAVATFQTSSLTAKTHTIKASYPGDATFKASSGTVTQVVNLYASTTTLAANPDPSTYGQTVQLSVSIASNAPGGPTGTVTFKNGTTSLGTSTLSGGTASLSTTKLPAGSLTITATYSGDAQSAKSSGTWSQTVNQATTSTSISSSLNPSTVGRTVKFTATVTSATTTPTGAVTFMDGSNVLATVNLAGAKASYSTSVLAAGSHSITAVYGGTVNIVGSTSPALTQTVN